MSEYKKLEDEYRMKYELLHKEFLEKEKQLRSTCPHEKLHREWGLDFDGKREGYGYLYCLRCSKVVSAFDIRQSSKELLPADMVKRITEEGEHIPID